MWMRPVCGESDQLAADSTVVCARRALSRVDTHSRTVSRTLHARVVSASRRALALRPSRSCSAPSLRCRLVGPLALAWAYPRSRRVPPTCSPSHRHLGLPRLSRRETPQSDAPPARSKHPHLRAEPGLQRRTASSSLRHATCAAQGGTHAAAFLALLLGPAGCTWRRRLVKGVELPRRL